MSHLDAQLVRLYDTVFDRAPDPEGRAFWNSSLDQGYSFTVLAEHFMRAPEFAATYGQPTNRQFVVSLYENILDRPGDAEGVAFWTAALDQGRAQRAETVIGFSESPEHLVQMARAAALAADTTTLPETRPGPYPANPAEPKVQYARADGDVLVGGEGFDQLNVLGFSGVTLWGQGGDDHVFGWGGDDTLHGGAGNDTLVGHDGNDRLYGGPGDDALIGGEGNDVMTGGEGRDIFVFGARPGSHQADTIVDFGRGDSVRFTGDAPVGPYAVSTGPSNALVFDLNMAREREHTIYFEGLTVADAGWVRETFIFG